MCDLCNGTHVAHTQTSYSIGFQPCPVCGPHPDPDSRLVEIYNKFHPNETVKNYQELKIRLAVKSQSTFVG